MGIIKGAHIAEGEQGRGDRRAGSGEIQHGDAGIGAQHGGFRQMAGQVQKMGQHGAEHPRVTEQRNMALIGRNHVVKALSVPAKAQLFRHGVQSACQCLPAGGESGFGDPGNVFHAFRRIHMSERRQMKIFRRQSGNGFLLPVGIRNFDRKRSPGRKNGENDSVYSC